MRRVEASAATPPTCSASGACASARPAGARANAAAIRNPASRAMRRWRRKRRALARSRCCKARWTASASRRCGNMCLSTSPRWNPGARASANPPARPARTRCPPEMNVSLGMAKLSGGETMCEPRGNHASLSPCGRGCPRGGEAERGRVRGRSQMEAQTPHPARARCRSALATLSHKGRGKSGRRAALPRILIPSRLCHHMQITLCNRAARRARPPKRSEGQPRLQGTKRKVYRCR